MAALPGSGASRQSKWYAPRTPLSFTARCTLPSPFSSAAYSMSLQEYLRQLSMMKKAKEEEEAEEERRAQVRREDTPSPARRERAHQQQRTRQRHAYYHVLHLPLSASRHSTHPCACTCAAQRHQRKLARKVLGSSFDAIMSRTWSVNALYPSSQQRGEDTKPAKDGEDQDNTRKLPSLPEGRSVSSRMPVSPTKPNSTTELPPAQHQPRDRRSTTSDLEGTLASDSSSASSRSRGSGGALSRSVSVPVSSSDKNKDSDKDTAKARQRADASPSKARRAKAGGSDTLPPGAALYYQARQAQEQQAQMMAKAYGNGTLCAAYQQWRRRQKIPDHVKVFCMGGKDNAWAR